MPIKIQDLVIIIPALALVITSFFTAYSGKAVQSNVNIKAENKEWIFPLDADEILTVRGPLGDTVLEIHNKKARILSSPCANQTCVTSGAIDSQGQWSACLPNRVMLQIAPAHGKNIQETQIDAATW